MPRIRSIKHDFFLDDELAQCSFPARILFAGLWVIADRAGRLQDRPITIKVQILPYDDVDVNALLAELADKEMIIRYRVEGKAYIQVRTFTRHQKPHPKEPESAIPGPPDYDSASQFQPESDDLPCVYFIQPEGGGLIKIGYTKNVNFRLEALQTGCPVRLNLLGVIAAPRNREREVHQQFSHLRQDGEWFEANEELLEFIKHETVAVISRVHRSVENSCTKTITDRSSARNGSGNGDLCSLDNGNGVSVNTHMDLGTEDVCVPKSKFSFEEIRRFAWASYRLDQQITNRTGTSVEGIRNPEGWAVTAHRSGEFDALIQEYIDNPKILEVAS